MLRQFILRNMRLYFRDRGSVFFSLLSTLVVLVLMLGFLGESNVDATLSAFGLEAGEPGMQEEQRRHGVQLVTLWTVSGILVVNAFSVSMTMVGMMVRDGEQHRLSGFFVAPVKRGRYVLGYILAAVIVASLTELVTIGAAQLYLLNKGGGMFSLEMLAKLLIAVAANIFSAAAVTFFLAVCVGSLSAWGGLSTLVGTLLGFLAGIYLPYGELPEILQRILKWIPVFQGTSALREIMMEEELAWFGLPEPVLEGYGEHMGILIQGAGHSLTLGEKLCFLLGVGILFFFLSAMALRRKQIGDR